MRPRSVADVLAKLDNVRAQGEGKWQADCPCAGHTTPGQHLSISDAGDKALLTCFVRHDYAAICEALGFESLAYGNGNRIEATYDYTDADGKLVYQVVRQAPKEFRQRRPDGNGNWLWNVKGVEPVLYRLPAVIAAKAKGQAIYVCEGEKDADSLAGLGLAATTNSGGAEKWHPKLGELLEGADVCIVPDRDAPGKRHADKVAASLCGKAESIRILELPDLDGHHVKDATDWLAAGGTREELERMASEALPYHKDAAGLVCMAEVEPETVCWLWWPYMPLGKLTLLDGDPGIGKSWVALAIATGVSLGKGLPMCEAREPANVVLASAEDGLADTIRPRLDAMGADVTRIHAVKGALDFSNNGLAILDGYIEAIRPTLVVIDPLVAYIGAKVDMHRANETRAVMARVADMADRHSVAVLAIRHLTKHGTMNPIYRGLGSIDFVAASRSQLIAGCDSEDDSKRGIVHVKSNLAPKGGAIGYQIADGGFYWTGESDLTWERILATENTGGKSALDEATEFLREELAAGPTEVKEIERDADAAGINTRTLRRARESIGVKVRRQGEPGRRGGGRWVWELPGGLDDHDDHIKESGHLNENSFGNEGLGEDLGHVNQAPGGHDGLAGQDQHEGFGSLNANDDMALLGLTADQVLEIWKAEGEPAIPLSQCETCHDLAKTLSSDVVNEAHIQAVTEWLTTTLAAKR